MLGRRGGGLVGRAGTCLGARTGAGFRGDTAPDGSSKGFACNKSKEKTIYVHQQQRNCLIRAPSFLGESVGCEGAARLELTLGQPKQIITRVERTSFKRDLGYHLLDLQAFQFGYSLFQLVYCEQTTPIYPRRVNFRVRGLEKIPFRFEVALAELFINYLWLHNVSVFGSFFRYIVHPVLKRLASRLRSQSLQAVGL